MIKKNKPLVIKVLSETPKIRLTPRESGCSVAILLDLEKRSPNAHVTVSDLAALTGEQFMPDPETVTKILMYLYDRGLVWVDGPPLRWSLTEWGRIAAMALFEQQASRREPQ